MSDKLPVLIAYALVGIALGLAPLLFRRYRFHAQGSGTTSAISSRYRWAEAIILGLAITALYQTHSLASPILVSEFAVLALLLALHRGQVDRDEAIGAGAALVVAATLPWWRRVDDGTLVMGWAELLVFFLLSLAVCQALRPAAPHAPPRRVGIKGFLTFCLVLIAVVLSFGTGVFPSSSLDGRTVGDAAWHHWGAYVGPSEMVRAGARLFHDLPAQYGMGPTLLIAALCSKSCWDGMYFIAGFGNLVFFILVAGMAYKLRGAGQTVAVYATVMLLSVFCCLLWTAYPVDLGAPIVWPSVGGLRFLPVVALVALLFWNDAGTGANAAREQPTRWGHLAWALGTLWSPESAFCVTFVWWPYYLWRQCACADKGEFVSKLVHAAATLFLCLAALVGFFLAAYWLVYETSPTRIGLLAYFLYPPGATPINPGGAIWFFGSVLALGLAALFQIYRQSGDCIQFRRAFLVLLLDYGTFSYFLGRSVDNNLLNLLPYQLLVLLVVVDSGVPKALRHMAVVLAASLLGWASVFGWGVWLQSARAGLAFEFEPSKRIQLFKQNPDAERAVTFIRSKFGEPATVLDGGYNLTVTSDGAAWSAIHGPANYSYLPPVLRQEFLANTARTLRRSGWIVVPKQSSKPGELAPGVVRLVDSGGLIQDIARIYRPTQGLDFGTYHAIRFEPR